MKISPVNTISVRRPTITFLPAALILAAIAAVSAIYQIPVSTMTRDVTAIANIHPLSGLLSSLGILLWTVTASICLFSALVLRNVESSEIAWFLLFSAFLSMYLLFDDLFQIHESLAPQYLGLSEEIIFLFLGLALSGYFIKFRRIILRTDYIFLLLALGMLAFSVAIDVILEQWMWRLSNWTFFFEDGAKWLGIASWCSYYSRTSFHLIVGSLGQPGIAMQSDAPTSHR